MPSTSVSAARGLSILLMVVIGAMLADCTPLIAVTPPVAKLGLVAPFEGRERATGYEALYAAKLSIREHNVAAGQGMRIELLALDSGASPGLLYRQARALSADPDVRLVLIISAASIEPQIRTAFAPLQAPLRLIDPANSSRAPDAKFTARYQSVSGGAAPGAFAVQVYDALVPALASVTRATP